MNATEAACDDMAWSLGMEVIRFSDREQARITAGVPDRRYREIVLGLDGQEDTRIEHGYVFACWFECKSAVDRLTRAQLRFLEVELSAGNLASAGDRLTLRALWLLARAEGQDAAIEMCWGQLAGVGRRGFRGERKDGTPYRPRVPRATSPSGSRRRGGGGPLR